LNCPNLHVQPMMRRGNNRKIIEDRGNTNVADTKCKPMDKYVKLSFDLN
jgi:hypothetical protein